MVDLPQGKMKSREGTDLYWIKECGHAPMMEHPDTFNEKLLDWLKKRNF